MEATIYADRDAKKEQNKQLTMTMQEFIDAGAFCGRSRRRIKKLFAGREALSALDVLELDIPDAHKLWAVLREELIPARTLHLLAVEFARAALLKEREAGREPDERSWRALDVKLAWLDGKASDEELEAAKAAADAAATDAAKAAARATAWAAADAAYWAAKAAANAATDVATNATNAATDAAWAAATDAAWTASRATNWATWDAARDDARAEQVGIVKRMLGLAI